MDTSSHSSGSPHGSKYLALVRDFYSNNIKVIDDNAATREIGFDCSVLEEQGYFLYELAKQIKPVNSLEVGLAWGGSAVHILCALHENGAGHHTALDPFQVDWSNIGVREADRLGLGGRFTCVRERSEAALPRYLSEGRRFQYVFIDGDHRFDAVFVDFFYCQKILDVGGVLILDDAASHTVETVTSFIDSNMSNLERIPSPHNRFAAYRKSAEDGRDIGHAVPFTKPV